jgi:uncharacterized membrane protein (TIGR01666 family)
MQIPVKKSVSGLKQFLLSQYFYDGLKITFGVVFPSIICFQFNQLETGMTLSLGALLVSITDNPGAISHKRNAMLAANLFLFLLALIIGFTNRSGLLLAFEIPIFCFLFSMLTVFGARASAVGIAALLVIVVTIDQHLSSIQTLVHASILLVGGLWYFGFSLLLTQVLPYRAAEQALGECIVSIAKYIQLKANNYDPNRDLMENQKQLLEQQIKINESLENVREIVFKTRKLIKDASPHGNLLLLTFIDAVDIYENATESHQNYENLQQQFKQDAILSAFKDTILQLAFELKIIGITIHNHEIPKKNSSTPQLLIALKTQIDLIEKQGIQTHSLKKILVNLRNMSQRVEKIYSYKNSNPILSKNRRNELSKLSSHQQFGWVIFKQNLTFQSSVFRHSIRVAIVCLLAFIFARNFYTGQFSYWILLTIIVILKPAFSQTKKRNYERMIGTVAGGLLGILMLYLIADQTARFWLLILFMLLTYSFARIRYVISVFFMTPFILILFSFLGHDNDVLIVKERILDTFIGAGIAFMASYFILPSWESHQLKKNLEAMLVKNRTYFHSILGLTNPSEKLALNYRVSRKEMFIATSNLSAAFQRMLNEPKRKQNHVNEVNKFILLNNLFASKVAAIAYFIREENGEINAKNYREIRKINHQLRESIAPLSTEPIEPDIEFHYHPDTEENNLQEYLVELTQLSNEIRKICSKIQG